MKKQIMILFIVCQLCGGAVFCMDSKCVEIKVEIKSEDGRGIGELSSDDKLDIENRIFGYVEDFVRKGLIMGQEVSKIDELVKEGYTLEGLLFTEVLAWVHFLCCESLMAGDRKSLLEGFKAKGDLSDLLDKSYQKEITNKLEYDREKHFTKKSNKIFDDMFIKTLKQIFTKYKDIFIKNKRKGANGIICKIFCKFPRSDVVDKVEK